MPSEQDTVKIAVPVEDSEAAKKKEGGKKEGEEQAKKKKTPEEDEDEDDLTPEERKLKEDLEEYVKIVTEKKEGKEEDEEKMAGVQKAALEAMRKEIRSSTSSMTSVPLPLKFLRKFYSTFVEFYAAMKDDSENKKFLSDIISVLAMTMGSKERDSLKYKLSGSSDSVGSWGHEYVRNLAGEIGREYEDRQEENKPVDELLALVSEIVPFNMTHNAVYEAVDLLMEVERLDDLADLITKEHVHRICPYIVSCTSYTADPEERSAVLLIAYNGYLKNTEYDSALRLAIKMDKKDLILKIFEAVEDPVVKKQLGFILGANKIVLEELEDDDDEEFNEVVGNGKLQALFLTLAQELDVTEAKTPDDIYKSHLEDGGTSLSRRTRTTGAQTVDSAKQNLAATFVNAFVNAGFGKDLLITPEGSDWLYKNKTHGMMSAAASLGMILLWDVECGFSAVDKYSFSQQNYIKAGALLASGLLSSGVTSEMDAAHALLSEHVEGDNNDMKIAAIYGLGLAYAGSNREDLLEYLVPPMVEEGQTIEIVALTCLSLGLVYCGTGNDDVSGSVIEAFLDRSDTDLNDHNAMTMCVGLGLLFIGQEDGADGVVSAVQAIEHPINELLALTIRTCAYTGTGSMLEIQKLLQLCSEHIKDEEEDDEEKKDAATPAAATPAATPAASAADEEKESPEELKKKKDAKKMKSRCQELAVIGIAMIAMGESLSSAMALRSLDHLLQYGELNIRRSVPLALGLLSISNPQLTVMDTLSKLSHDNDQVVSMNAVVSLGFIGAGTNNARIAGLLRSLAAYYAKEPNHLFLVRIAQGLLHLGKGLMTLDPHHSEGLMLSKVGVAGLLTVFLTSMDLKRGVLNKQHYLLFSIVTAIRPRFLITLDEELNPLPVKVMVGTAVDIVGQAGKPKRITGFQQHTTPVLLAHGERAEFAFDKYLPLTSVLEGVVICKPNPDWEDEEEEEKKSKK